MALNRAVVVLLICLAASTAVVAVATRAGAVTAAITAAASVPLAALAVAVAMNRRLWTLAPERITPEAAPVAARRNAILMAMVFGWGAATLLITYPFAGLRWYHWWQYGGLMALVAMALVLLARSLGQPGSWARSPANRLRMQRLTLLQAMAILGGLGWLLLSDKVWSVRDDWVANLVFVFGGLALAGLSFLAAGTEQRLARRRA